MQEDKYTKINWKVLVRYCEHSPSGLRWKVELATGRHGKRILVSPEDVAGSVSSGRWMVRFDGSNYIAARVVWILTNGGIDPEALVDHRDGNPLNNKVANLRLATPTVNKRNSGRFCNNTSGETGVCYDDKQSNGRAYWVATWVELDGKPKQKHFPVKKLGYDAAKEAAIKYRREKIEQLNAQGAGYTERHGIR